MSLLAAVGLTGGAIFSVLAAHRVSQALALDFCGHGRGALLLGLTLGGFLTVTGLAGQLFRSFDPALLVFAGLALGAFLGARRLPRAEVTRPSIDRWVIAACLLVLAVYAWVAFKYQMHDEHPLFGHKSMIEQLRYGEYPPYFPPLPAQDARYHYGFDVLSGALARAFGLSADLSIDLSTLLLVLFLSLAAAALATELAGPRAAAFAAVAIHFGAGLAWVMLAGVEGRHPRCLVQYHHPSCGSELFPTPFLNVFQHPVAVGVPFLLLALLLARRFLETERDHRLYALLLVLVLPALALGQIVYFVLGVLAMLAALPFWLRRAKREGQAATARRRALHLAAIFVVAAVLARLLGGMLTPSPVTDPGLVAFRRTPGFPSPNLLLILRHHLANLGIGFACLPFFAYVALKRRSFLVLALAAFALGGIIIPHFWTYTRSWDIVKFPSASAFVLSMLYVALVDAPLLGRGLVLTWTRRAGRVLLLGSGALAALFVAIPLQGDNKLYDDGVFEPDPVVKGTIDWWRGRTYARDELIYAQSNIAQQLSVFGGLSVVAADYDFQALGIKDAVLAERAQLSARVQAAMDPAALQKMGVRWVMLSGEELQNLGPVARARLEAGTPDLEVVTTIPGETPERARRIWRVGPAPSSK